MALAPGALMASLKQPADRGVRYKRGDHVWIETACQGMAAGKLHCSVAPMGFYGFHGPCTRCDDIGCRVWEAVMPESGREPPIRNVSECQMEPWVPVGAEVV